MVRVNLNSKIQSAKVQLQKVAQASEKTHCKSLSEYVLGSKYRELRHSLKTLEREIDQLKPDDSNILKIKDLWGDFQKTINSCPVEGEINVKNVADICSRKLEVISQEIERLEKRYQQIPKDSPFASNDHYPLDLCLLSDSFPVKNFLRTYYLVDDKGRFKAFVSDAAIGKMKNYSPDLRAAEGYFEVDSDGNPIEKLAKNEITKERLIEMEELYNKIAKKETTIEIIGSKYFKSKVLSSIKIAISRDSGYNLFKELTDPSVVGDCPIFYTEQDTSPQMKISLAGSSSFHRTNLKEIQRGADAKFFTVNTSTGKIDEHKAAISIFMRADVDINLVEQRSTKFIQRSKMEYFIALLHETCHAYHFLTDCKAYNQNRNHASKDSKDSSLEEQLTMYGRCEGPSGTFADGNSCRYSENLFRLEHGLDVRRYHMEAARNEALYYEQLQTYFLEHDINNFATYLIVLYSKQPSLFEDPTKALCHTLLKYTIGDSKSARLQELAMYLSIDTVELSTSLIRILSKDQVDKLAIIKNNTASKYRSKSAAFVYMLTRPQFSRSEQINFLKINAGNSDFFKNDKTAEIKTWGLVLSSPLLLKKISCDYLIKTKNFSQEALKVAINSKSYQTALQMLKVQPSLLYQTISGTPCNLVENLIVSFEGTPDETFQFIQYIVVSYREYIDFDKKEDSGLSLRKNLQSWKKQNSKYNNIIIFIALYEKSERASSRAAVEVKLNPGQVKFYKKTISEVAAQLEGPELLSMPKVSDSQWANLSELISEGATVTDFVRYLSNEYISPYCSLNGEDNLLNLAMRTPECDPKVFLLLAFYFDTNLPLHEEIFKDNPHMRNFLLSQRKTTILTCNLKVPIKTRVLQYKELTNISRVPMLKLLEDAFQNF